LENPILFICDLQTAFQPAMPSFPSILVTATKLLRASKILSIPVYVTTQNAARLGPTHPDLPISHVVGVFDKTKFSMMVPEISAALKTHGEQCSVAITGIESHICVTQTALDLLKEGHKVYIIADGVGSCNSQEIGVALDRLRNEGCTVTSSESWMYEVMGDAKIPEFKQMVGLVKEYKDATAKVLQSLL
ncbi:Isochorismatase-like protein, partial [Sphaerosporella brunnea]